MEREQSADQGIDSWEDEIAMKVLTSNGVKA
jgi:hypothetical protein